MDKQGGLRAEMPTVAGWVDDLRDAFGKDVIDSSIRFGMRGHAGFFHAIEGEHSIGTLFNSNNHINVKDMVILVGDNECETKRDMRRDTRQSKRGL